MPSNQKTRITVDVEILLTLCYYHHRETRLNATKRFLKNNLNASRPSEYPPVREEKMSKRLLGGIKGCKYKTSSWYLNGFPDGSNIGSTV